MPIYMTDLPECPLCRLPRTVNRIVNFTYTIVENPVHGRYDMSLKCNGVRKFTHCFVLKRKSPLS